MATVHVQLPVPAAPAYDVRIEAGLITQLGAIVRQLAPAPTAILISDSSVAAHYLPAAKESLSSAGYRVIDVVFPAGEVSKTINTAVAIMDKCLHAGIERATPVVALGGGVVGDMTGFVAATLLRGLPFFQVPTTLLSAVDASVGGKVGVDHAAGKNLIGAFHQPRAVLTDIATFKTLPEREIRCGLAECIKHGIIRDHDLFMFISQNLPKIMACDIPLMTELVRRNVQIKANVVQEDPFEKGVRALLNLGHTFGHALETLADYSGLQHGEAVALGMVAAANLSVLHGMLTQEQARQIRELIEKAGLPSSLAHVDVERTFEAMGRDKKVLAAKIRLILPTGIGTAEVVRDVPDEQIKAAIATLKSGA